MEILTDGYTVVKDDTKLRLVILLLQNEMYDGGWQEPIYSQIEASNPLVMIKTKTSRSMDGHFEEMTWHHKLETRKVPSTKKPMLPPEAVVSMSYRCGVCQKVCSSQTGLQNHIYHNHRDCGSKAYRCNQCDNSYTTRSRLNRHVKQTHMGIYDHICPICHKGFANLARYKGHLVSHGGKPEFNCIICSKAFRYKEQLQKHIANVHNSN